VLFKEIEKRVDLMIREFIKDHCYETVFDRTEIKEIEKTAAGTRYSSKYIYKKVFNEQEYKSMVRAYYLREIEPLERKEKQKRNKKERGTNITQEEFFQVIFREHFDHRRGEKDKQGRRIYLRSFLANIDSENHLIENSISATHIEKVIKQAKKYGYFTPNMFISHKFFTKEMLSLLGVIVLDFDLDSVNMVMTKEEVYNYIKKKLNIEPSMIWDTKTKGNYQVAILINSMTGTPKSVHLYEQVVKEMCCKLGSMVDAACVNANHLFSIGQNNKRKSRLTRKYNETIYSIDDFRWLLLERDERRRKENPSKVMDFTKEAVRRHPAIKALFEADAINWRDHACFTLGLVMRFLGYSQEECENYIRSVWQPKVDNLSVYGEHFTTREATKCIRHAYSDRYKCFHSHWVEVCTGIDCNLRGYFRFVNQNKGIYQTGNKKKLTAFLKANEGVFEGTREELAIASGINYKTLDRIVGELKKSNELHYETIKGAGNKTVYALQEAVKESEMVIDMDDYKSIDEEMYQIFELEEAMKQVQAN
jgi:hypothetical protein